MRGGEGITNGQGRTRIIAIKLNGESKQTDRDYLKECITSEALPNKPF